MKKTHKFVILSLVAIMLFIILYYLTLDTDKNNFIINTEKKNEKLSTDEAEDLGVFLMNEALIFYEKTPGNTNKTVEINGEKYLEMNSFLNDANKTFSKSEIDDFINHYKIVVKDKKYYIKETNNELIHIYDDVKLKPRFIGKERIIFKATWEYCDAKKSSELSECEDTESNTYKNTFVIEKKNNKWKIVEFSLPDA